MKGREDFLGKYKDKNAVASVLGYAPKIPKAEVRKQKAKSYRWKERVTLVWYRH